MHRKSYYRDNFAFGILEEWPIFRHPRPYLARGPARKGHDSEVAINANDHVATAYWGFFN